MGKKRSRKASKKKQTEKVKVLDSNVKCTDAGMFDTFQKVKKNTEGTYKFNKTKLITVNSYKAHYDNRERVINNKKLMKKFIDIQRRKT